MRRFSTSFVFLIPPLMFGISGCVFKVDRKGNGESPGVSSSEPSAGSDKASSGEGHAAGEDVSAPSSESRVDPGLVTELAKDPPEGQEDGGGVPVKQCPDAGTPITNLEIRERFGISHPDQIIDFDLPEDLLETCPVHLIDESGQEVLSQKLSGNRIAIRTALVENGKRQWKLIAGPARAPSNTMKISETDDAYEITNGITGVRIPKPGQNLEKTPGPIQGILYRDGAWTAKGPNDLHPCNNSYTHYPQYPCDFAKPLPADSLKVEFAERGPLKIVVRLSYRFSNKADVKYYVYFDNYTRREERIIPGGAGYYTSTLELQLGQPSVLIEDDTDMDLAWRLNAYNGLEPDQARYKGHGVYNTDVRFGRNPDGSLYRGLDHINPETNLRPEAIVDLNNDRPTLPWFASNAPDRRTHMRVWQMWEAHGGWYWNFYNSQAGPDGNILGLFGGRASRALGIDNTGVGFFNGPNRQAGLQFMSRRYGENSRADHGPPLSSRLHWGLFVGQKGPDLPSLPDDPKKTSEVPAVQRQMNLHGGINLNKFHRYPAQFFTDKKRWPLYMDEKAYRAFVGRVRSDKNYYDSLYSHITGDPYIRDILKMLVDDSGRAQKEMADGVMAFARELLDNLVHREGIFARNLAYWGGGSRMISHGSRILFLLNNEFIKPEDRERLIPALFLFASVLWDDDFSPLQGYEESAWQQYELSRIELGNPNMPVMQQGGRNLFAMILFDDPVMAGRAARAKETAVKTFYEVVNEAGANMSAGAAGYIIASAAPLLNNFLQLKVSGIEDVFASHHERLANFARFLMNFLTPPEPRFGGLRVVPAVGDAPTGKTVLPGILANGFRDADAPLSSELMKAWELNGKDLRDSQGSTVFKVNGNIPPKEFTLKSEHFDGYYSVLRNGWGTNNETALWFINGNFLVDHRHWDMGEIILYALGAPLSVDWASIYYPTASSGYLHSVVVPEADEYLRDKKDESKPRRWNEEASPTERCIGPQFCPGIARDQEFAAFNTSSFSKTSFRRGDGRVWQRRVLSIHADADYPVIWLADDFGEDPPIYFNSKDDVPDDVNIFSLNLMSDGDVKTPDGGVYAPVINYGTREVPTGPSSGPVLKLPKGVNRFHFTGQSWGERSIDWDLFTYSQEDREYFIGGWGHRWSPTDEGRIFKEVNGRDFEEHQQILRIKGKGPFRTLILPHRKSQARQDLKVLEETGGVVAVTTREKLRLGENFYSYTDTNKQIITAWGADKVNELGCEISGGPLEIIIDGDQALVTVHGRPGLRGIALPGSCWETEEKIDLKDGRFWINYEGPEARHYRFRRSSCPGEIPNPEEGSEE